jgi:hypothetical protein
MYSRHAGLSRSILHRHIVYGQPRSGYVRGSAQMPRSGYVRGSAHTSSWLAANRDLRKRVATYYVGPWVPGWMSHTTDNSVASN